MPVPEHLERYATREAIDSLAERFGLRNEPIMQDWEYEVADPDRLDEFIATYDLPALTDDERFVLMEIIIQSFEDSSARLADDQRWRDVLGKLEQNIATHARTVVYWAVDDEPLELCWSVTPFMRALRDRLSLPFTRETAG